MANLITLSRLALLILVVAFTYLGSPTLAFVNVALLILMFATDGLDGYVARRLKETSQLGAVFDIVADRIVELCLWMLFVDLGLLPTWILVVFVIRGVAVDSIRTQQAATHGIAPFSTIRSRVGRFIVASSVVRFGYAVLKAMTFCVLMALHAWMSGAGVPFDGPAAIAAAVAHWLVWCSVLVCVLRGVPVIVEFVYQERSTLLGSLATNQMPPPGR